MKRYMDFGFLMPFQTLGNFLDGVVTIEYAKSFFLNKDMIRRSHASYFETLHFNVMVTEDSGETSSKVKIIVVKVKASRISNVRMLHVAIFIVMSIS